jgi:hypothetical protein
MDTYTPAYPKPKQKRQKIHKHPPLFPLGYCWGCHREFGLDRHHIYGGNPDRQHSDRYGLYVHLCHKCHQSVTDELDRELIDGLHMEGQRRFESVHGAGEFERVFGRNYL